MAGDVLRRTGGWCVELMLPLKHGGGTIDAIEIRPPDLNTVTRWGRGEIPSSLALLAELCGVPERALRCITYPDADRLILALFNVVPQQIKNDFTNGAYPLATPDELLPAEEPGTRELDPEDPRFPKSDVPVRPKPRPVEPTGGAGFDLDGPEAMKAVR